MHALAVLIRDARKRGRRPRKHTAVICLLLPICLLQLLLKCFGDLFHLLDLSFLRCDLRLILFYQLFSIADIGLICLDIRLLLRDQAFHGRLLGLHILLCLLQKLLL